MLPRLRTVIEIGIDEDFSPYKYDAFQVYYFDFLPSRVILARKKIFDIKNQYALLAAVTSKNAIPVNIFMDGVSFNLKGQSLDFLLMENKINPLSVSLLSLNVDGDIKDLLKAAEMLFNIGLRYVQVKNFDYNSTIEGYGFKQTEKGLFKR